MPRENKGLMPENVSAGSRQKVCGVVKMVIRGVQAF